MAMIKPITLVVNAFDATQDHTFYFTSSGGNQVVKNEILIKDNKTNVVAYNSTVESYQFNQTVPSNTLENGNYYNVAFRTYDIDGNVSQYSEAQPFYCYTTPIVELNLTDGQVIQNSSYEIELFYNQTENELLNYAVIDTYDSLGALIDSSGNLYDTQVPPFSIYYTLNGLENTKQYKTKATILTVNGTVVETETINYRIQYENPSLYSSLNLEAHNCDGYISVQSDLINIDGKSNPNQPIFIDNEKVEIIGCCTDILNEEYSRWVKWNKGFEIPTNFTLRLWFTPTYINDNILYMGSDNEYVSIKYVRGSNLDYISVSTQSGTNILSNGIEHTNGTNECFLWVQVKDGSWTVILEEIKGKIPTVFDWNTNDNTVYYNIITDKTYLDEDYENYNHGITVQNPISNKLNSVIIGNGIYNNINITKNTNIQYSKDYPIWDFDTILDCSFNNTINGGNVNIVLGQLDSIKLKRRNNKTKQWITVYEKKITGEEDLNILVKDGLVPSGIEQTYAIVPTSKGNIEGEYIIDTVTANWQGVFITDGDKTFKLYTSVVYDSMNQNKPIGVLNPIGTKYGVIISNSENNYRTGIIQSYLYGYTYEKTRKINRNDVVQQVNDYVEFLTNNKTKSLVDWNGNSFIFGVTSAPTLSYNSSYGNGIASVAFSFAEQGKYDEQEVYDSNDLIK